MESILDFDQPLNVQIFDQVASMLSTGNQFDIVRAQEVLTKFQEHPDALYRVDKILMESNNMNSRFIALQVLNDGIRTRWMTIDEHNQSMIRNFIINLIAQECTSFSRIRQQRALLTKMNSVLVSIAKREYPTHWSNCIQDICTSADPSTPMVENNLNLLKLMGEEMFVFEEKSMTSRWAARRREALKEDFQYIMNLCGMVIVSASDPLLLKAAVETLAIFVPFIEPAVVIHPEILVHLTNFVTGDINVRLPALRCLTEYFSIKLDRGSTGDAERNLLIEAFRAAFGYIVNCLPASHSSIIEKTTFFYEEGGPEEQEFISVLNLMLDAFLQQYITYITYDDALLVASHEMMVGMSGIEDQQMFKTCVKYWCKLGEHILEGAASNVKKNISSKLQKVLSHVRFILIKRMAKPEEVIIVQEEGEFRRERVKDVEQLHMYELMRNTLVVLTHIDARDTQSIMVRLMEKQLDRSEWSWDNCSRLAWAVGAISLAMPPEQESALFTTIISGLLTLCKESHGKDNRAAVASNVLFVAGQYPRYLRRHPKFLAAVTRKVFSFMEETFPGVQDMSVDTFYKLCEQLGGCYVQRLEDGPLSFAESTAQNWTLTVSALSRQQIETCFAAVGFWVAAEEREKQANLLEMLLHDTNALFKQLVENYAHQGRVYCQDEAYMMELLHYLRIFSHIAGTCGDAFVNEMYLIALDLFGLYRLFTDVQTQTLASAGASAGALNNSMESTRCMRLCKREILKILEAFIENSEQLDYISQNVIGEIFSTVLVDYQNSIPAVKEAGAMALAAASVRTLGARLSDKCDSILSCTFDTTVAMIAGSFETYPEFRLQLLKLLQALNEHCFDAFIRYASSAENVLDGLLWSIKHFDYPTMSTALETLDRLLEKVVESSYAEQFYTAYIDKIFQEVLFAAMDTLHAAGFPFHCRILRKLFGLSDSMPADMPVLGRRAVLDFLVTQLLGIPTQTVASITEFVTTCFDKYPLEAAFNTCIADFLIESKVWGRGAGESAPSGGGGTKAGTRPSLGTFR
ncbi:exportin-1 [Strigomonas culicis]|uniref:Exportin-1 n=1 Tax=Strigomonas culicis TaxID=28005 RepID=S9V1U0_9TRYP|nr:exportin-1 [Strigomonas culicis]|eukprot:EPY20866.1 exportin-1 [Strigomonas culicis]